MKWMLMSLVILTLGLTACENPFVVEPEEQTTETRDVGTYESITINASVDVILRAGTSGKLKIKSGKNMIKKFRSKVKGGVLEIDLEKVLNDGQTPVLYVSLKSLNYIVNKGSGKIRIELIKGSDDDCHGDHDDDDDSTDVDDDSTGFDDDSTGADDDSTGVDDDTLSVNDTANVQIGDVTIYVLGSGSVELINASIDRLRSNIRGSGRLKIEGDVNEHECEMKGSGDRDAEEAPTRHLDIYVSGSGSALVTVTETLKAKIKGSGRVEYHGDPSVDSDVTGSGHLIKLD